MILNALIVKVTFYYKTPPFDKSKGVVLCKIEMSKDKESFEQNEIMRTLASENLSEVPETENDAYCLHLDISNNNIKTVPDSFFRLISLNASGNDQFQPMSLSNLHYLRTLSLDFCSIKSFKVIPNFPHLTSLSLIGNEIKSFKYMPIFGKLKSLDLRGNEFTFDTELGILATGSINIETINGEKITKEQLIKAFKITPIVGIALRKGMNPQLSQNIVKESISFLTKGQTSTSLLQVINHSGSKVVILPCDAESAKWYAFESSINHRSDETLTSFDDKQWSGDWVDLECPTRTLPVTPRIQKRIIRCDYKIEAEDGTECECSAYTEMPVNWDGDKPLSTETLTPSLTGRMATGALVILECEGNPRINWFINNKIVDKDNQFLEIPEKSEGQKLRVECSPVSSSFPDVEFSAFSYEDQVKEAKAEITEFSITENPVADEPIDINITYFPSSSSNVHVFIEAAKNVYSPFEKVCELEKNPVNDLYSFTPTKELADCYLRASCFVGEKAVYAYAKTPVKYIKIPTLEAKICGPNMANHAHVVIFENQEIEKTVSWLLLGSDGSYTDLKCNDTVFTPNDEHIGGTLCVHIIPHSTDEIYAESTVESPTPIVESTSIEKQEINEAVEDSPLTMETEGSWEVTNYESPNGFASISFSDSFTPTYNEVGLYLRFISSEESVFFGLVLPTNKNFRSVTIDSSTYTAGSLLSADVDLYERNQIPYFTINWIRCTVGGDDDIVVQEGGFEYSVQIEDVGCKIKARVSCENEDEIKESNLTPMIKPGMFDSSIFSGDPIVGRTLSLNTGKGKIKWFREKIEEQKNTYEMIPTGERELQLVFSDVQRKIRCHVITKRSVYTEVIGPILPINVYIGDVLSAEKIFRPSQTRTLFKWMNENDDLLSTMDQYVANQSEAGTFIRVVNYANETKSGDVGEDSETVEIGPMLIRKVDIEITKLPDGSLKITGDSIPDGIGEFFWRIWRNGYSDDIDNNNSQTLVLLPAMIGCEIDGGWRMLETDEIKWSTNKILVEKALQQPEAELIEEGPLVVGCCLKIQAKKLQKYKLSYEWKRWDGSKFIQIKDQKHKKYIVSLNDCDCYVCCDVRYIDTDDDFKGPPFTVRTSGVVPPATYITIEGKPMVGTTLVACSNDSFVDECDIEWQRCKDDEDWVVISTKKSYTVKEEDIDCVIRVIGTEGQKQRYSSEIGPVYPSDGTNEVLTTENDAQSEDESEQTAESEEPKFGEEFKFKGKDQAGENWAVIMNKSGFIVKNKTSTKNVSWTKGSITSTVASSRKINLIFGGKTKTILPVNLTNDMDTKTYRNYIIEAAKFFKEK